MPLQLALRHEVIRLFFFFFNLLSHIILSAGSAPTPSTGTEEMPLHVDTSKNNPNGTPILRFATPFNISRYKLKRNVTCKLLCPQSKLMISFSIHADAIARGESLEPVPCIIKMRYGRSSNRPVSDTFNYRGWFLCGL